MDAAVTVPAETPTIARPAAPDAVETTPSWGMGHITSPSDRSDLENVRGPTSGELQAYGSGGTLDRGLLSPPTRGPLAGIDLLHYCRTGQVRRTDGGHLTPVQEGLR